MSNTAPDMLDWLADQGIQLPPQTPKREEPLAPTIRRATFCTEPTGTEDDHTTWRESLIHSWGSGHKVFWITLFPDKSDARIIDLPGRRMRTWTYRGHYAGFAVASLLPVVFLGRHSRRAARVWRDTDPQAFNIMMRAASKAGQLSRALRCDDVVLAHGPLSHMEATDLDNWLSLFRAARGPVKTRWLCIGTDTEGWPVPPSGHGRTAPPIGATLMPYRLPVAKPAKVP